MCLLFLMRAEYGEGDEGGWGEWRIKQCLLNIFDDMAGYLLVWLTKAMTEEQAPRPTGKGLAMTRHQITYLAQLTRLRRGTGS